MAEEKSLVVTVTGGAGRIAYSLVPLLLHGHALGPHCGIHLRLLDIPAAEARLQGLLLEIKDSFYPLLRSIVVTTDPAEAFRDCEVAVLVGGYPRLPGMERKDLLVKNAQSIQQQAQALNTYGSAQAKVLVVANPANTNALVAMRAAPRIPRTHFTALTRLDQERLRGLCAERLSASLARPVSTQSVRDVFILGNHSTTQVAYLGSAKLVERGETTIERVCERVSAEEYDEMLTRVQNRGAEVLRALQASSALSAAEAIARHLRDWLAPATHTHTDTHTGTHSVREAFSMGVLCDGSLYGDLVPADVVFSLPCERCDDESCSAGYRVVQGLQFDAKTQELMRRSAQELLEERSHVEEFLR